MEVNISVCLTPQGDSTTQQAQHHETAPEKLLKTTWDWCQIDTEEGTSSRKGLSVVRSDMFYLFTQNSPLTPILRCFD